MPLPLPYTMGVDLVGKVVALGDGASRFKVGDRVMTMSTKLGAWGEHIAVDETWLGAVPDALDDVEAATLPIPAMSAWISFRQAGELPTGARVLIHGASGVVGALVIQLAKQAGAHVIGTASAKNREFVLGLGADEFIDYTSERFEDRASDIDVVFDYVQIGGTDSTTDRSWSVLKAGGTIVSLADPAILGKVPEGYHGYFPNVAPEADVLEEAAEQLARGKITTQIAQVYPRGQLLDALDRNQAGGTAGRLIVDFKQA